MTTVPIENWQKIKLLKLAELLRQETDEEHPMTTMQICERMEQMGIPCDRRVLSKDIVLLNDLGIEVLWVWVGKGKGYYVSDRSFSVPELKILMDAVQAASFITEKKTKVLIEKIAGMGGSHRAEILKSNIAYINTKKHSNESIFYSVDALEGALQRNKKVIFRYFDLDIEGRRKYRKDGNHYLVEPIALIYNEDNYYLVALSTKHEGPTHYRVDRMDVVEITDEDVSKQAIRQRERITEYAGQLIKMYGGELQTVALEFDEKLIGVVYDRFGEDVKMIPSGAEKVIATVQVQISPTFWGWLFQFGKQMQVISPETVTEEYKSRVAELLA